MGQNLNVSSEGQDKNSSVYNNKARISMFRRMRSKFQ